MNIRKITVNDQAQDSRATRWSLLARLKNWEDQQSWREFFDAYWRLIYSVAIKAGLNDADAQDVVPKYRVGGLLKKEAKRLKSGGSVHVNQLVQVQQHQAE